MHVERAGEVRHHHDRSVEDADEKQFLARVVPVDLGRQLGDPRGQLVLGHEDSGQFTAELGGFHGPQPATTLHRPRGSECRVATAINRAQPSRCTRDRCARESGWPSGHASRSPETPPR